MPDPLFTQIVQVGIVVADLDAAVRRYLDHFGIGPWTFMENDTKNAKDVRILGQPARFSSRTATAMVGNVYWELIQPLDSESIWARFLAEKGGGVHHIAVRAPSYDRAVELQTTQGRELLLSGTFEGIQVPYLDTQQDLGVILEVFSGFPGC